MPPKGTFERLKKDAEDKPGLLERCLQRLEWERTQERCGDPRRASEVANPRRPARLANHSPRCEVARDALEANAAWKLLPFRGVETSSLRRLGDLRPLASPADRRLLLFRGVDLEPEAPKALHPAREPTRQAPRGEEPRL
eukprot:195817-Prorocentrum_minimum.AAC.1